jgi:hypothetical protein
MSQLFSLATLRTVFKYAVPLLFLIWMLLAITDQFARPVPIREVLAHYSTQTAVLIGVGYHSGLGIEERVKYYQLLPSATAPPRRLTISRTGDGAPVVDDSGANWVGFLYWIVINPVVLALAIRMWRQDLMAPSNTSLERKRDA